MAFASYGSFYGRLTTMTSQLRRPRILGPIVAVAVAVAALAPTSASAVAVTVTPPTVTDFTGVTIDGTIRTATATMSGFTVSDADGLGWHVTVQTTRFAEVDPGTGVYVPAGKLLPAGSLTMPAPTVSPSSGVSVAAGPYALDGATVQIPTADATAVGTFEFTQTGPLTLTVPASAYARTYRAEVTVTAATGP